jgi:hypothetical protein
MHGKRQLCPWKKDQNINGLRGKQGERGYKVDLIPGISLLLFAPLQLTLTLTSPLGVDSFGSKGRGPNSWSFDVV